ncbi:hypothetical protein PAXRUDRAFT_833412 [Paxillus rubicundulus Ve08.2h10]|uniref:Uncharacterized protein n=1 Tax=Paxillus rubicundulus Ve08.2h10 TaxID=930991 RepID=A0A0D0DP69_9AGAM|nr:hypothetical protein PAXRUDRAFT_833412 [Paxillus rubicundulus Ve08.2h10]
MAANLQTLLMRSKPVLVQSHEVPGKTEGGLGGSHASVVKVFERTGCNLLLRHKSFVLTIDYDVDIKSTASRITRQTVRISQWLG